jgi:hypothetical protein
VFTSVRSTAWAHVHDKAALQTCIDGQMIGDGHHLVPILADNIAALASRLPSGAGTDRACDCDELAILVWPVGVVARVPQRH